jgi:XTP/dITP diphosphohydrolase
LLPDRAPKDEPRILIATGNQHKVTEIRQILSSFAGELLDLTDFPPFEEPEELAPDYLGNAIIKARFYAQATGIAALADDSGLEAHDLGGRPGVLSARYGGRGLSFAGKIDMLLAEIARLPDPTRAAHFRCAVALAWPDGLLETAEASCEGKLLESPIQGDQGFGYDPIFVPLGHSLTFSQLSSPAKNDLSHRGRALRALFR